MPDSISVAATKIAQKVNELRARRFDIGPSIDAIREAGYGGYYQDFRNGRIYTHHAVGTFEVHGGILRKFLSRNGVDVHAAMQRREMGFPKSDETLTPEGHPVSIFEWGEIIFFPGTGGGVAISGEIYKTWRSSGLAAYGYPITSNLRRGRYEYCIFERGICIQLIGQPQVHWMRVYCPLLGNPAIVNLVKKEMPVSVSLTKAQLNALGGENEVFALLNEHYALEQVSNKTNRIPLFVTGMEEQISVVVRGRLRIRMGCQVSSGIRGREKGATLYNLVVKNDNGGYSSMSPHCIYHRPNWLNFGLLHATDIHVSRRIDHFKPIFRSALAQYPGHASLIQGGISNLNNWNNGFRDFIRYANAMYRKGVVDAVIATGDIVDYLFEHGEFKDGGGNFKFFRDLVLGHVPYPDNEHPVEELLVPIFVTLGNHDYRVNPYEPYMRLDITLYPDKDIKQFAGFNLTKDEARVLQGGNPGKFDDDDQGRVKVSTDTAKAQVVPATNMGYWNKDHLAYYKKYINYGNDYLVTLGTHKIIMMDTGPDVGGPDGSWDTWDAITTAMGFGDTNEVAFQERKAPNSQGPAERAYNSLKEIKATDGVVIVGMHAPPINIFGNEYNHFFRETEHSGADPFEIVSFLRRCSPFLFSLSAGAGGIGQPMPNDMAKALAMQKWPGWFTGGPNFKVGSPMEFVHEGVSRGNIEQFLKLICGLEGSGKPIDLLLTGHNHCMSEMRLRWDANAGRLMYFTDFYTENPSRYHNSAKYKGTYYTFGKVGIEITPGASPNGTPQLVGNTRMLDVPPYANPLNSAGDKQAWWNAHKPLLVQGAPLGPTDHNNRALDNTSPRQPSFEGCKLIVVRKNLIDKIIQVSRNELAQNSYEPPSGVTGVSFGVTPELGGTVGIGGVFR